MKDHRWEPVWGKLGATGRELLSKLKAPSTHGSECKWARECRGKTAHSRVQEGQSTGPAMRVMRPTMPDHRQSSLGTLTIT